MRTDIMRISGKASHIDQARAFIPRSGTTPTTFSLHLTGRLKLCAGPVRKVVQARALAPVANTLTSQNKQATGTVHTHIISCSPLPSSPLVFFNCSPSSSLSSCTSYWRVLSSLSLSSCMLGVRLTSACRLTCVADTSESLRYRDMIVEIKGNDRTDTRRGACHG
jgi:hypothetical protein